MSVIAPQSTFPLRPYITVDQLRRAPMSLDISHFFPDEQPDAQTLAEMRLVIARVTGMINNYCHQPLHAAADTDAGRVPVTANGMLSIATRRWPIREVIAVEVGPDPVNTVSVDLAYAEIRPMRFEVPSPYPRGLRRPYARWTTVAGWPVATLAADVTAGATSLEVDDATGVVAGVTQLLMSDGASTEYVTPTGVTGNTLTVPPLGFAHTSGCGVSGLPSDITQAALLLIDAGLKYCDSHSLTLIRSERPSDGPEQDQRSGMMATARELLSDYRRVI